MKITKWVDMGAEVEVEIDANDIAGALSEAFANVTEDRFEDKPTQKDVLKCLNLVARFMNGLKDEHMQMLSAKQRDITAAYMEGAAARLRAVVVNDPECGCGRGEGHHTAISCGPKLPLSR